MGWSARGSRAKIATGSALVVVLLASRAPSAHAQGRPAAQDAPEQDKGAGDAKSPGKDAERHFTRARALYDEGDFPLALVEFKRAYELSPNYRVLYNIGQVNIQLFNYAAARTTLEKYLKDGGDEIPSARKKQVEADLAMLEGRTAHLKVVSTPPADVTIDDMPAGHAPFEAPLLVNAGQRKIVVTKPGYTPATRFVVLAGGDTTEVKLDLAPLPNDGGKSVIVVPTEGHKNYTPAVIGWIATGTLGVAAAITGGLYLSKESELDELSSPSTPTNRQNALDASSDATRLAVAADVLGLAALGAGLVSIYFTLRPPRTEAPAATTGLRVRPSGAGATFSF